MNLVDLALIATVELFCLQGCFDDLLAAAFGRAEVPRSYPENGPQYEKCAYIAKHRDFSLLLFGLYDGTVTMRRGGLSRLGAAIAGRAFPEKPAILI